MHLSLTLLAQSYTSYTDFQLDGGQTILGLIFFVITVVGMWKVFDKAKQPGWTAIIPILNIYILLKVAGRPGWWLFLFLAAIIPVIGQIVAFIAYIIVSHDVSKSFGKDVGMTLLLIFLPFIGYPVLGFGSAKYKGPAAMAKK